MLASKGSLLASKGSILASKGSMLSSKGNMLSCMILLAIEVDTRVQLLARIRHRAVSRCTRARLNALVHYFTRDLNLMLADITCQAFIKMLAGNLNSRAVKYMQARVSHYKHTSSTQGISRKLVLRLLF